MQGVVPISLILLRVFPGCFAPSAGFGQLLPPRDKNHPRCPRDPVPQLPVPTHACWKRMRARCEKGFAPSWCLVSKNRANGKNPLEETSSGAEQDLNLCRKLSEQHLPRGAEGKFHCHSVKTKQTGKKIIAKYTSLGFEGGGPAMNLLVEFSEPYFSLWMHPKPLQLAGHPR